MRGEKNRKISEDWVDILGEIWESGKPETREIVEKDRVFALTFAPISGENYFNIYGVDITERKEATKQL